jgi:hypothetical protein
VPEILLDKALGLDMIAFDAKDGSEISLESGQIHDRTFSNFHTLLEGM